MSKRFKLIGKFIVPLLPGYLTIKNSTFRQLIFEIAMITILIMLFETWKYKYKYCKESSGFYIRLFKVAIISAIIIIIASYVTLLIGIPELITIIILFIAGIILTNRIHKYLYNDYEEDTKASK